MKQRWLMYMRYLLVLCSVYYTMSAQTQITWYHVSFFCLLLIYWHVRYFYVTGEHARRWLVLGDGLFVIWSAVLFPATLPLWLLVTVCDMWLYLPEVFAGAGSATILTYWIVSNPTQWVFSCLLISLTSLSAWLIVSRVTLSSKEISHRQKAFEAERELQQQVSELERQMQTYRHLAILQERQRISRDIHDSVGHSLSTIIIQLGAIAKLSETAQPEVAEMSRTLRDFAADSLKDVRQVVHDLKPLQYDNETLGTMIENLCERTQRQKSLTITFRRGAENWLVSEQQSVAVYRSVQELLANAQRHGQATRVRVTLIYEDDTMRLTVQDNGVGSDNLTPRGGLVSMQERLAEVGGMLYIESAAGKGSTARIVLAREKKGAVAYDG